MLYFFVMVCSILAALILLLDPSESLVVTGSATDFLFSEAGGSFALLDYSRSLFPFHLPTPGDSLSSLTKTAGQVSQKDWLIAASWIN